jgi:hypothetical protein
MTLEQLVHYKAVAAVLMATVGWPILSAVLNVLLRKKTSEQWEAWAEKKPGMALVVELMRALGADPSKAMLVAQRYASRKAAAAKPVVSLPPALTALLSDPEKLAIIETAAKQLLEAAAQPPQPASPAPPSVEPSESRSPVDSTGSSSTEAPPA